MNKIKVFIDGQAGTTGLQLKSKLVNHPGVTLLEIDEDKRKDATERQRHMNDSDVVFLCLPDAAAIEAVKLVTNEKTVIIDASTAHRTADGWTYGFPELSEKHYENIKNAKRIANPGCHATGFISIVYPLVSAGIMPSDYPVTAHSITGYSGGGNKMIADYENPDREEEIGTPRQYGLGQTHKHLPEMKAITGLDSELPGREREKLGSAWRGSPRPEQPLGRGSALPIEMRPSFISSNLVESREAPQIPQYPSPLRGSWEVH